MAGNFSRGVTLIELMVVMGVIGIILLVGAPLYQDYIAAARTAVLNDNIQTIRVMQDERRRDLGEYVEGDYVPGGSTTLTTRLGWTPRTDSDDVTYQVLCATDGANAGECSRTSGYTVTATHSDVPSDPVSRTFNP